LLSIFIKVQTRAKQWQTDHKQRFLLTKRSSGTWPSMIGIHVHISRCSLQYTSTHESADRRCLKR